MCLVYHISVKFQVNSPHLSDSDKFELRGEREDAKQFNLTEGWLQELVIRCHGFICDVVVTGNPSKVCYLGNNKTHSKWWGVKGQLFTINFHKEKLLSSPKQCEHTSTSLLLKSHLV